MTFLRIVVSLQFFLSMIPRVKPEGMLSRKPVPIPGQVRGRLSQKIMLVPMPFILLLAIVLTAPAAPAWSFGFTVGAPIEERSGSDPGAQSYVPAVDRCRLVVLKDRHGRRVKVRRCQRG